MTFSAKFYLSRTQVNLCFVYLFIYFNFANAWIYTLHAHTDEGGSGLVCLVPNRAYSCHEECSVGMSGESKRPALPDSI